MQITADLDAQHLEKLKELLLRKTPSELITLAIDEIYKLRKVFEPELNEGQQAYQLMEQSGFIGSFEGNGDLSENYKSYLESYLDWSNKI